MAVTEKYRPVFEEKAKESYEQNVGRPSKEKLVQNSAPIKKEKTRDVMAKLAGVSHDTYDKGRTILKSNNEEVKQKVLSGDMSINAGYNEIRQRGIGNTNPIKLGRCLVELERIYGVHNGGDKKSELPKSDKPITPIQVDFCRFRTKSNLNQYIQQKSYQN